MTAGDPPLAPVALTSNGSGSTRTRPEVPDWLARVLFASVAVALAFLDVRVRRFPDHVVTKYIPGVLDGTYGAPGIYRILVPYSIDFLARVTAIEPLAVFLATRLMVIYAALVATHVYLRQWYSAPVAIGATLGVAALLPLTFTNSWAHPDSFPELLLFTLGCLAVARRWDWLFWPTLVLATFNRETSGFLVLLWGCYRLPGSWSRGDVFRFTAFGATWAAIFGGLRLLRGLQHYQYLMLWENLAVLKLLPEGYDPYTRVSGYFWLVLLVPAAFLAWRGTRGEDTPSFMRRALPVAAMFVVTAFLISAVIESRIFLPMFPLLLPAVTRALSTDPLMRGNRA